MSVFYARLYRFNLDLCYTLSSVRSAPFPQLLALAEKVTGNLTTSEVRELGTLTGKTQF